MTHTEETDHSIFGSSGVEMMMMILMMLFLPGESRLGEAEGKERHGKEL